MAFVESTMIPIGMKAPSFQLVDSRNGELIKLPDDKNHVATLVMFICNHCPYVVHVLPEIVRLSQDYLPKGVRIIAISSNDIERYPQDSPERMKELAEQFEFDFPYVFDEDQSIAHAYDAVCTPEFYLFDGELKLCYRGRMDSSRPGNREPLTGRELRQALDALLAGEPPITAQYPGGGCSIKWKQ